MEFTDNVVLEGVIENVIFHNDENGYSVLKISDSENTFTVVGQCLYVAIGENIICEGVWFENKNFGKQLQATSIRLTPPTTLSGIERYLASGLIHGIGPHLAKTLVDAFKEEIFEVIDNNPEKLKTIPGIGESRIQQITSAWHEQSIMREAMIFLQGFGIGTNRAHRIFRRYGQQTIAMIKHNPYALFHDISGIGFRSADAIALKLGIDANASSRISAGLDHALEELASNGHCLAEVNNLVNLSANLLNVSHDVILENINEWSLNDAIMTFEHNEQTYYSKKNIHEAEQYIAKRIIEINNTTREWSIKEFVSDFKLYDSQKEAFQIAINNPCSIITGGPGVGKTTILKAIIQTLTYSGVNLMLAAPTGRAAKRMHQSTGVQAKTIHRLLEYDPVSGGFKKNELEPLKTDVIILDEASMIDIMLFSKLLKATNNNTSLIIVGDVDQLPSVGPGNVLSDLINSGKIATARLTEIFRQAKDSSIIINAHRINNSLYPIMREDAGLKDFYLINSKEPEDIIEKISTMVAERIPNSFNTHPIHDVQILTPMRKGLLGTENLNNTLQAKLNPPSETFIKFGKINFYVGDKVMQHQNDYEKHVFNGDIGYIEAINIANNSLSVRFEGKLVEYQKKDLENLSLSYACTIHKSQGSEFPVVIIPVHMQHYVLLEKNLLYTAITRAKKLVILIGDSKAIHKAINTILANKRDTALSKILENF